MFEVAGLDWLAPLCALRASDPVSDDRVSAMVAEMDGAGWPRIASVLIRCKMILGAEVVKFHTAVCSTWHQVFRDFKDENRGELFAWLEQLCTRLTPSAAEKESWL